LAAPILTIKQKKTADKAVEHAIRFNSEISATFHPTSIVRQMDMDSGVICAAS
jgi:hypothetical protein